MIVVNGVRYHADRPLDCALCAFWKNRKTGCILGEANCYYLAEAIVTRAGKEVRGMLLCKRKPLCQRLLLQGPGSVAERQTESERRFP